MKTTRILFALTLTLACLGIIGIITVSAVNPEPAAHGSAQSGNLMLVVSAIKHQDGSIDGHATFRDGATNTKLDIDIDCMIPSTFPGGDVVILSGPVSKSTSPDFLVGSRAGFVVRDNGEGPNFSA